MQWKKIEAGWYEREDRAIIQWWRGNILKDFKETGWYLWTKDIPLSAQAIGPLKTLKDAKKAAEEDTKLKKTIVKAIFKIHDKQYAIEEDFGYGYPVNSAEFMFTEGNYACDCNRSIMIRQQQDPDFPEYECGEEIKMIKFEVIEEEA